MSAPRDPEDPKSTQPQAAKPAKFEVKTDSSIVGAIAVGPRSKANTTINVGSVQNLHVHDGETQTVQPQPERWSPAFWRAVVPKALVVAIGIGLVAYWIDYTLTQNKIQQAALEAQQAAARRQQNEAQKQRLAAYFAGVDSILAMTTIAPESKTALIKAKTSDMWGWSDDPDRNAIIKYLGNINLAALSFHGFYLGGLDFSDLSFPKADFGGANLSHAKFDRSKVQGANFREATLVGTSFKGTDAREANFSGVVAKQLAASGANFELAKFDRAELRGAKLDGSNLSHANLVWVHLEGANMHWAECIGTHFQEAHLEGAYLSGTNFEGADLRMANMLGAWFGPGKRAPRVVNMGADAYQPGDHKNKIHGQVTKIFPADAIFNNAILENAIWDDGKVCPEKSIGQCGYD